MQSHLLKTFTANFDPEEDRIRLDCDLHIEEQAQIFFTQRLGRLFILELVKKVEQISNISSLQDLTNDMRTNSNEIKQPVSIAIKQTKAWLIKSIDFENLEDGLRIIFKDNDKHAVHLEGDETLLRNIQHNITLPILASGWPPPETRIGPGESRLAATLFWPPAGLRQKHA